MREWRVEEYLADVRATSVVLPNEAELRRRARAGDKAVCKELITSYLSLAAELGLRLAPNRLTELEAIQEANLVLMRVVTDEESPAVTLGPCLAAHFNHFG